MPSARQKNSLLAVGKNLAQLPDKDESGSSIGAGLVSSSVSSMAGFSVHSYALSDIAGIINHFLHMSRKSGLVK